MYFFLIDKTETREFQAVILKTHNWIFTSSLCYSFKGQKNLENITFPPQAVFLDQSKKWRGSNDDKRESKGFRGATEDKMTTQHWEFQSH